MLKKTEWHVRRLFLRLTVCSVLLAVAMQGSGTAGAQDDSTNPAGGGTAEALPDVDSGQWIVASEVRTTVRNQATGEAVEGVAVTLVLKDQVGASGVNQLADSSCTVYAFQGTPYLSSTFG